MDKYNLIKLFNSCCNTVDQMTYYSKLLYIIMRISSTLVHVLYALNVFVTFKLN